MRLEDWQKQLESQWLDDEAEPKKAAMPAPQKSTTKPAALAVSDPVETVSIELPEIAAPSSAETEDDIPVFQPRIPTAAEDAPAVFAAKDEDDTPIFRVPAPGVRPLEEEPPVFRAPDPRSEDVEENLPVFHGLTPSARTTSMQADDAAELPTFTPPLPQADPTGTTGDVPQFRRVEPDTAAPVLRKPVEPSAPSVTNPDRRPAAKPAFASASDLDADIPAFSRYLPASRRSTNDGDAAPVAKQTSIETPKATESTATQPLHGAHQPVSEPMPAAPPVPTPEKAIPFQLTALPLQIELPLTTSGLPDTSVLDTAEAELKPETFSPSEAKFAASSTSRRRARHARNVRPENVPSGLSARELWTKVPHHVETLLALGRMEEQEVAQSSYKRPFAEGRLELIERLLDPILSLEDTARLLNVCPTTVRRYTNRGILTHYRKEPERADGAAVSTDRETRQRRFRLSDILAFLETQQAALNADRDASRTTRTRRSQNTPTDSLPALSDEITGREPTASPILPD